MNYTEKICRTYNSEDFDVQKFLGKAEKYLGKTLVFYDAHHGEA